MPTKIVNTMAMIPPTRNSRTNVSSEIVFGRLHSRKKIANVSGATNAPRIATSATSVVPLVSTSRIHYQESAQQDHEDPREHPGLRGAADTRGWATTELNLCLRAGVSLRQLPEKPAQAVPRGVQGTATPAMGRPAADAVARHRRELPEPLPQPGRSDRGAVS